MAEPASEPPPEPATKPAKPRNHGARRSRKLWLRRECVAFCAALAELGDPVLAAARIGRTVVSAFAMRDADGAFRSEWERAIAIAWEMVELRLLGQLLAREPQGLAEDAPAAERRQAEKALAGTQKLIFGLLEGRLAATMAKPDRPMGVTRVHGKPVDNPMMLSLREAIHRIETKSLKSRLKSGTAPHPAPALADTVMASTAPTGPHRGNGHAQPHPC